ncbi:MAG: hypothetical protein JWM75_2328 [Sphingomonas bacterium]|nr:hypothetical protein [Sphingomonas bacterium]
MSDSIFVSHERADAGRAMTIINALRAAGYAVDGDEPDTEAGREAAAAAAARAWVVLVLWSEASIGRTGARQVADVARAAAERGAYLGATIDKISPPFGFTGFQVVDLSRWGGGRDSRLAGLVEDVRKRMERLPTGPMPGEGAARKERARRAPLIAAAAAAILIVLAAAAYFSGMFANPDAERAARIDAELAAVPCAWLQVDPVDNGTNGKLVLTGVADQPERAGETIRGLLRRDGTPAEVTIDRVARIGSDGCPAIDVTRRLRRDDGGRMRIMSDGVQVNPGMGLAEARVLLTFRPGDMNMALFGIEPSGAVTTVLPDMNSLATLKDEDVGYVQPQKGQHEFSLRSDHTGWTGLILIAGEGDFAGTLTQGEVRTATQFAQLLEQGTAASKWSSEMVWYKIEPR